jgi:glycosyltransferase involved in cell wall biosynthesis
VTLKLVDSQIINLFVSHFCRSENFSADLKIIVCIHDTMASRAYDFDDVSVVMGTYNESAAIETVLREIDDATGGDAELIVVDSSTDDTAERAREHGARVIEQPPLGYGVAVQTALEAATRPVRITTDCDGTYPMDVLGEFVSQINHGYDVVSGDRLYHGAAEMPPLNRLGNRLFAWTASLLCGTRLHDVTTGMRAYHESVIKSCSWTENTGLSAELLIRPAMRKYRITEKPIQYHERMGETTLNPLQGGIDIATSIVRVCLAERYREFLSVRSRDIEVDRQS